ncbi:hypothetical protein PGTUg99_023795 [Puccinia graminis f. sp. tritici]|uniref:Uncharacterized protein n=1 Tax=Puccinia graminis f. sp. tritici TaxID=56615 RepID=A0A5B0QKU0_PUCGR|nr:hypothetical protein PGTUg99_023795 [Puccinia graminis f. sp. tritici]
MLSSSIHQKSHHTAQELDSTDKFTLGHHGGVTGTHLDQQLSHNGQHITMRSDEQPIAVSSAETPWK